MARLHNAWSSLCHGLIYFLTLGSSHGLLKKSPCPDRGSNRVPWIYSRALYHVPIKAGLYHKAVQVYDISNLYPVTFASRVVSAEL